MVRMQYSEMNDDAIDNANLERGANAPDSDPVMEDCYAAFDEVASGRADPTHGATHYHEKTMAHYPAWADPLTGSVRCYESKNFYWYKNVS